MLKIKKLLLVIIFAVLCTNSFAQISVKLELNKQLFLQYEGIYARVTFRNDSGNSIIFGSNKKLQGGIDFVIENKKQEPVSLYPNKKLPNIEGLILKPNASEEMVICLSDYYDLKKRDKYRIKANIKHARIPFKYKSEILPFSVVKGMNMWEKIVGVPDVSPNGETNIITQRTFKVVSLQEREAKYFYLVVEDKEAVYSVSLLGRETGVQVPICKFDIYNNLHILLKVNPRIFTYMKYNIKGDREQYAVYKVNGTINLEESPETKEIMVVGGVLAPRSTYEKVINNGFR